MNYYASYKDAKADGFSEGEAGRAGVDTTIDTVVGGSVQAGSVAFFTAAILFQVSVLQ